MPTSQSTEWAKTERQAGMSSFDEARPFPKASARLRLSVRTTCFRPWEEILRNLCLTANTKAEASKARMLAGLAHLPLNARVQEWSINMVGSISLKSEERRVTLEVTTCVFLFPSSSASARLTLGRSIPRALARALDLAATQSSTSKRQRSETRPA